MTNRVIKVITSFVYFLGHERVKHIPGDSEDKGIRSGEAGVESLGHVSISSKKKKVPNPR